MVFSQITSKKGIDSFFSKVWTVAGNYQALLSLTKQDFFFGQATQLEES